MNITILKPSDQKFNKYIKKFSFYNFVYCLKEFQKVLNWLKEKKNRD